MLCGGGGGGGLGGSRDHFLKTHCVWLDSTKQMSLVKRSEGNNKVVRDPDPDSYVFWASRIRIRILPFSHKNAEWTEIKIAK
jgi:hypothetical protein